MVYFSDVVATPLSASFSCAQSLPPANNLVLMSTSKDQAKKKGQSPLALCGGSVQELHHMIVWYLKSARLTK
jgi:hypothetical protein